MAGAKEIRTKIGSIKNTQKITRAMEMVAASKMRKAQDRMRRARPYAEKIRNVIAHLAAARTEYVHPFLVEREARRVGYIVVSTDRGLCGGLNTNTFRLLTARIRAHQEAGVEIDFCAIGNKALGYFRRLGGNVVGEATHYGDTPTMDELIGPVQIMIRAFESGTIDKLYLVYNELVNTMTQAPVAKHTLHIAIPADDDHVGLRQLEDGAIFAELPIQRVRVRNDLRREDRLQAELCHVNL